MRTVSLLFLVSAYLGASAQHPFLSRFSATVIDDGVFLEWTISKGNRCNGTQIERALIDEEFIEVGGIEGVCGSVEEPEDFSFLDTRPISGNESRYRLLLGQSGYTQEVSVTYFNLGDDGFLLFYDSISGLLNIVSDNRSSSLKDVCLFDLEGSKIETWAMNSSSSQFSLRGFMNGAYIVRVTKDSEVLFSQKFIKIE